MGKLKRLRCKKGTCTLNWNANAMQGLYMESCTCNYFFQARHGYTSLIGVDYSEGAINLAKSIAVAEQVKIKFLVCFFKFNNMYSKNCIIQRVFCIVPQIHQGWSFCVLLCCTLIFMYIHAPLIWSKEGLGLNKALLLFDYLILTHSPHLVQVLFMKF